ARVCTPEGNREDRGAVERQVRAHAVEIMGQGAVSRIERENCTPDVISPLCWNVPYTHIVLAAGQPCVQRMQAQVPVFTSVLAISTICRRWPSLAFSHTDQMPSGSSGLRIRSDAGSVCSASARASSSG